VASLSGIELLELSAVDRSSVTYALTESLAGFSRVCDAWAIKLLRTDSVSRGLCISLFKLEIISLAISIRLLFFTKCPFFER
jgi:hypothetical protein